MIVKDTFTEYAKHKGLNASALKSATSPRAYHKYLTEKREPSQAMALGSLFHNLLLEPENQDFVIAPDVDKRTKAGKEAFAEFEAQSAGKLIVTKDQHETALEMLNTLSVDGWTLHPFAEAETSLYLPQGKARFDAFLEPCDEFPQGLIIDIKTASASDFKGFQRASYSFGYDLQAYWYSYLFELHFGVMPEFRFLAIETTAPHIWQEFVVDDTFLESGKRKTEKALAVIERYKAGSRKVNETRELQLLTAGAWWE